ncbi:MAG: hypothetical protein K1X88_17010 [Nannocystaceae bacterium]|nr:hypothetical protein [Nannocystaceae bacterium]
MNRLALVLPLAALAACKPCEDDCREFIELSFASTATDGMFASTRYEIALSSPNASATCTIEVDAAPFEDIECDGDAVAHVDDGSGGGSSGTSGGGGSSDGHRRLVVQWFAAPDSFSVVARDAAATLVLDNDLTPAYQEQQITACDGQCRSFSREMQLPG